MIKYLLIWIDALQQQNKSYTVFQNSCTSATVWVMNLHITNQMKHLGTNEVTIDTNTPFYKNANNKTIINKQQIRGEMNAFE